MTTVRLRLRALLSGLAGWLLLSSLAQAAPTEPPPRPRAYALIICGVSGDKKHYDKFWDCATSLYNALRKKCGYTDDEIVFLFEDKSADAKIVDDTSTRQNVVKAFEGLAARMKADDRLFVFCLGHASRHDKEVRFNLPGPDITDRELGELLDKLPTTNVVCVITMPLSGYFIERASKPGRIIVTATDALPELSETVFPYHFVRGFYDPGADADGNGFLSILELFRYARKHVEEFFKEKELLQTEHPLLDDVGKGSGVRDPDPRKGPEGRRASDEGFTLQAAM